MKTLVMYGEAFDAQRMIPITSEGGHTVISFGIGVMDAVYDLYDQLLKEGALSGQKFTADPKPLDKNVPSNLLQDIVFKIMYSKQDRLESQLKQFGLVDDDAYTCACYLPEVGNVITSIGYHPTPLAKKGAHLHIVGDASEVGNLRTVIWGVWDVCMKI